MSEMKTTKEDEVSYPYVVSEDPVTILPEKTENRRSVSKKRMICVVCVCLILLLLITIAFILILLFVPTRQIAINNTTHRIVGDRTVDEVEFKDSTDSLMEYLVSKKGEQISVILDLNRNLEIMRISMDSGFVTCFVTPILALDPKTTAAAAAAAAADNETNNETRNTGNKDNQTNESTVVSFKRSNTPIRDTSILGPKGVALCKDTEVYWAIPQCEGDSSENQPDAPPDGIGGRKKRASWNQWCRWDWTNCYYFSFTYQSVFNFYRCAILCTWVWY